MLRTRIAVSVAAAAAGLAVLTACSGAETAQPVVAPAAAGGNGGGQVGNGQVGNAAPASNESKLIVADVATVGQVLTDQNGMTLYRFDKDTAKPPKSNCDGDCAKAWPPLLIKSPGKIFPKGINPKIIGYVERADGHCQVTINGWPVYYFAKDAKPGDILGQGVKGTWFAIDPKGGRTGDLPESAGGTGGTDGSAGSGGTGSDGTAEGGGGDDAPADPGY